MKLYSQDELVKIDNEDEISINTPSKSASPDSTRPIANILNDKPHRSRRVHPYFRDEYRLVRDLRRLVRIIDYRAVRGYESVKQLADISRKFSDDKQTKMIGTALAGGMANLLSARTNRQLRNWKIRYLQWKTEKVLLRHNFKIFSAGIYEGYNCRGFEFHIPLLRVYYSRRYTNLNSSEGLTFRPLRSLGVNVTKYRYSKVITPFILSGSGNIFVSYNRDYEILSSRYELRKTSFVIIRLLYVKYLRRSNADYFLSEVLFNLNK